MERVLWRNLLELRREERLGEDLPVGVDPLDGVPEGNLLLALRHVEQPTCN